MDGAMLLEPFNKISGLTSKAFNWGNFGRSLKARLILKLPDSDLYPLIRLQKSSGNSSMDALALKILQQAAPFEPFPADMASNYQQLEIIRDWNFTNY